MSERILRISVLVIGLVMLTIPSFTMWHPLWTDRPLFGAIERPKRPVLTARGLHDETFQHQFTGWYEGDYGFRVTASHIDNSIDYWILHETRSDKHVRIGADRVLFLHEQTWNYNRHDDPKEAIAAFAQLARIVQDRLPASGMDLLVLFLPAKTSYWEDHYPKSWAANLGSPRPDIANVYEPSVAAFEREGVRFVDGRKVLAETIAEHRELVYNRTGRHLNALAQCLILERGFSLLRDRVDIPKLDCRYDLVVPENTFPEEYDLLRLLNIWDDRPRDPIAKMVDVPDPGGSPPRVLFVGSSFASTTIKEAQRNHAIGKSVFFYYNRSLSNLDGGYFEPTFPKPGSPAWRSVVFDKRLVVLPLNAEYAPYNMADFLMQLATAIGIDIAPFEKILTK